MIVIVYPDLPYNVLWSVWAVCKPQWRKSVPEFSSRPMALFSGHESSRDIMAVVTVLNGAVPDFLQRAGVSPDRVCPSMHITQEALQSGAAMLNTLDMIFEDIP